MWEATRRPAQTWQNSAGTATLTVVGNWFKEYSESLADRLYYLGWGPRDDPNSLRAYSVLDGN